MSPNPQQEEDDDDDQDQDEVHPDMGPLRRTDRQRTRVPGRFHTHQDEGHHERVWLREQLGERQQALTTARAQVDYQRSLIEQHRLALLAAEAELSRREKIMVDREADLAAFQEANPSVRL